MKRECNHINQVSQDVEELDNVYKNIMKMETIAHEKFPRTSATKNKGYDGKIKFVTEGSMQMHLAEKDLDVAAKHNQDINPVEKGHIAFRTDDIEEFKRILEEHDVPFSDYGTSCAKEWQQIFFKDPVGNVIEVHQLIAQAICQESQ